MTDKMLILRGINNQLHELPARQYAILRGYVSRVLDVSGETGAGAKQVKSALRAIRADTDICALYGFSGGGYNARHILAALMPDERRRFKLVVILGAPKNAPVVYRDLLPTECELVYHKDPGKDHMDGPDWLLRDWEHNHPDPPIAPPPVPVPPPHQPTTGLLARTLAALAQALARLSRKSDR